MLNGLTPPFKVGERRSWLFSDSYWGASPLEYLGLAAPFLVALALLV